MKKLSITIGIPTYNEEKNIGYLIKELFLQKSRYYKLDQIIVADDHSSDRTVEILKAINNKKLKIITDTSRKGQNYRINQIINSSRSKIFVLLEADTLPENRDVVDNLIVPFFNTHKEDIGMTFGRWTVSVPFNVYEKIQNYTSDIKQRIFKKWKSGDNVYFSGGHSIKAFYKGVGIQVHLPLDVPEDVYFYLKIKEMNLDCVFSKKSLMRKRNVTNMKDRTLQLNKFESGINSLIKYFPSEKISKEYKIPLLNISSKYLFELLHHPVMAFLSFLDLFLSRLLLDRSNLYFNPKYKIYESSKMLIKNEL